MSNALHLPKFYISFFFLISIQSVAQSIEVHRVNFENPLKASADLSFLDSLVVKYKYFFSGEAHGVPLNQIKNLELFKYLYNKANVRYYVKEGEYTYTYFLNRFIQTGRHQWLDSANRQIKKNKEELTFYEQLFKFNSELETKDRIQIIGTDIEPFFTLSLLRNIIPKDKQMPAQISKILMELLKMPTKINDDWRFSHFEKKRMFPVLKRARESLMVNGDVYESYFGDDIIHFRMLVSNHATKRRSDINISKNFILISNHYNSGNYFFQYGLYHTRLKKIWFAGILDRNISMKNRVLTFVPRYYNCENTIFRNFFDKSLKISSTDEEYLIKNSEASKFTFFKIPKNKKQPLYGLSKECQFLLFIRDLKK